MDEKTLKAGFCHPSPLGFIFSQPCNVRRQNNRDANKKTAIITTSRKNTSAVKWTVIGYSLRRPAGVRPKYQSDMICLRWKIDKTPADPQP